MLARNRKLTSTVLSLFITGALAITAPTVTADHSPISVQSQSKRIQIEIDGSPRSFEQPASLHAGTTYVPLRGVFEALDTNVTWDASNQTVLATNHTSTISLTIGDDFAYIDGERVSLLNKGMIMEGSTMVPLRFVAEALGAHVAWNADTYTVTIQSVSDQLRQLLLGKYDEVRKLSNGIALVEKGAYYGFVNAIGEEIVPLSYDLHSIDHSPSWGFYDGIAAVAKDEKYGFIDTNGDIVIPIIYEDIQRPSHGAGILPFDFSGEILAVKLHGNWGIIDRRGNIVSKDWFDELGIIHQNDDLIYAQNSSKFGFINRQGEVVIPLIYNHGPQAVREYYYYVEGEYFNDGLAIVGLDGKLGMIDREGKVIIPFLYDDIEPFNGEYAKVYLHGSVLDGELFYVDRNGQAFKPSEIK